MPSSRGLPARSAFLLFDVGDEFLHKEPFPVLGIPLVHEVEQDGWRFITRRSLSVDTVDMITIVLQLLY
jgi:hypothetical protein